VLSKYTSLRSFHEQMPSIVPLDYDNVVLYHTYLLEAYMEYKYIVKQLNQSDSTSSPRAPTSTNRDQCWRTPRITKRPRNSLKNPAKI
jgi:hypothetical protein